MAYTVTGPFVNGGSPGISAQFLNNVENWIEQVDNTTSVSATGSVSGTVTLYEYLQGVVKAVVVHWANYKSAAAQTLALPSAFTAGALVWTGETQGQTLEFLSSGSAQTMSAFNTMNSSGGTENPATTLFSLSFAQVRTGFDSIRFTFTSTNASGFCFVIGN